jgi:hypothetical protein
MGQWWTSEKHKKQGENDKVQIQDTSKEKHGLGRGGCFKKKAEVKEEAKREKVEMGEGGEKGREEEGEGRASNLGPCRYCGIGQSKIELRPARHHPRPCTPKKNKYLTSMLRGS